MALPLVAEIMSAVFFGRFVTKLSKKVQDKIAEGKLKQYYSDFVLLEQPFVKDTQLTVGQLVAERIGTLKENIVVRRFARFKVGEESK